MIKRKAIGQIRAPQLVGMFGPGSIVNLEKLSIMPSGTGQWPNGPVIQSPTFAQQIGARTLIDTAEMADRGVSATLFPREFVCRQCGTIQKKTSVKDRELREGFRCYHDGGPLYPSRWIIYCENGHIDDFPYDYFVHGATKCADRITLRTGASLSETWVECRCGMRKSMIDAYGPKSPPIRCSGELRWMGKPSECDARPKVSMKSASDVYFGAVRSGISIEPESDPLVAKVFEFLSEVDPTHLESKDKARSALKIWSGFGQANAQDLDRAINEFFIAREHPTSYGDRRRIEFDALSRSSGSPRDDLYVEALDATNVSAYGFSGLYAVRKLREVRALVGFRRGGMPSDPSFDGAESLETLAPVGPEGSFPAYENRGEGIFLTLNPTWMKAWLGRPSVQARAKSFEAAERRWRKSSGSMGRERSRGIYVLAHTFAHLMIRQLALICGYSQSSLRERIYASEDGATPWAGFLVYTASSDADGSLGGLVAVATDGRVADVIAEALDSLRICSSDPVCALQTPRGFRRLNGAACHGCVVLPETCCERNNHFLDRTVSVPGTVSDQAQSLCYSTPH
jgi:hypothetical protein